MSTASSLFLRSDGTLLLAAGDHTIEIRLRPDQLLELGADSLRLAFALDPALGARAAAVLCDTVVLTPDPVELQEPSHATH